MKSSLRRRLFRSELAPSATLAVAATLLVTSSALASTEFDRRYSLETIGVLRSHDNVDGLFTDYVARAIEEYFALQPRFVLQDLSRSNTVLSSSQIAYPKIIEDDQILSKVARSSRSATLLRTRIFKEGPRYRFTMDWLHAPKMEAISTEVFYMDEPEPGKALGSDEIKSQLAAALDRLVKKIPFQGHITGRDQDSVTLNLGEGAGLKRGDTLVVGTLEEVKRHPLLKSIVEWRIAETGRIEVEQVDRGVTFGRVIEEGQGASQGRTVAKLNKVIRILPKSESPQSTGQADPTSSAPLPALPDRLDPPRYGWISAGADLGSMGRQTSNAEGTAGRDGSGVGAGARAEAQVWLNREWFVEGILGFSYYPYSQNDLATGAATGTSSTATLFQQRLGVGYTYLPGFDFFAAKSWIKLGTQSNVFTLAGNSTEQTAPVTFSGLYIGLGGDLPLRGDWGAQMNLNFGLTNSVTETNGPFGEATGGSQVEFYAGAFKRLKPRLLFRMGFHFASYGATYSSGATLTHRNFSITPSWVMLF
ncbi:MAG: hypothetical protein ACK5QT_09330 [Oligoflexia bacterium]|jgi:hypothetical protein